MTLRQIFQKRPYETLKMSLQAIKQYLKRHNIQELANSKHGCGYNQCYWPTVFSIFLKIFSSSNLTITIFQATQKPSMLLWQSQAFPAGPVDI